MSAAPKNNHKYKRLWEQYQTNTKSNDEIYKYYELIINKPFGAFPNIDKSITNWLMTEDQIKLLSEVAFK